MLDDVKEVIKSVPTQFDEFLRNLLSNCKFDEVLTQLREKCSVVDELISTAEQEANLIVTEAARRTKAMTEEAEKRVEAMKIELANLEEEKNRIAKTHAFEPMVTLNIGGQIFTTATATLTRFPDSMLGAMFSGRYTLTQDRNGAYCIDRDGTHFREILNFLRGSATSNQWLIAQRLSRTALEELKVEADFYGIKELMFYPDVIKSTAGCESMVAQGADKLWYIQHPKCGNDPRLVIVCDHCGHGWISNGDIILWAAYNGFTTGRVVQDAQPRYNDQCPSCKK